MVSSRLPAKPDFDVIAASAPSTADRRTLFLALIGNLVSSWSNNESLFIYVLMILMRTDQESAALTFATLNTTRARLDLIQRLVVGQVGMNLRPFRPFRIGIRHGLVGESIEILGALGLHLGVGPGRLPDVAKVAAAFEDRDPVSAGGECLCGDKPGDAGANDTNVLLLDHGSALPSDVRGRNRWRRPQSADLT
jgi:hypothetical protein